MNFTRARLGSLGTGVAEQGSFFQIPEVLTRVRLFPVGSLRVIGVSSVPVLPFSRLCYAGPPQRPILKPSAAPGCPASPQTTKLAFATLVAFRSTPGRIAYFICRIAAPHGASRLSRDFAKLFATGPWRQKIWLRKLPNRSTIRASMTALSVADPPPMPRAGVDRFHRKALLALDPRRRAWLS